MRQLAESFGSHGSMFATMRPRGVLMTESEPFNSARDVGPSPRPSLPAVPRSSTPLSCGPAVGVGTAARPVRPAVAPRGVSVGVAVEG